MISESRVIDTRGGVAGGGLSSKTNTTTVSLAASSRGVDAIVDSSANRARPGSD